MAQPGGFSEGFMTIVQGRLEQVPALDDIRLDLFLRQDGHLDHNRALVGVLVNVPAGRAGQFARPVQAHGPPAPG
jgi:hypothetical protein